MGVPDNLDVTNNSGTPSSQLGKDISHTGQVGTAFYVAPELSHTNRKTQYNQVSVLTVFLLSDGLSHAILTQMQSCHTICEMVFIFKYGCCIISD